MLLSAALSPICRRAGAISGAQHPEAAALQTPAELHRVGDSRNGAQQYRGKTAVLLLHQSAGNIVPLRSWTGYRHD